MGNVDIDNYAKTNLSGWVESSQFTGVDACELWVNVW
jgi:hypothetical protein